MGRPRCSDAEENQETPSDILLEILMKLPTEDVARCCCVSRQWRRALGDLSFRKLHAASPAALSAEPELLRLSREPYNFSQSIKTVLNVSTGKPMCSIDILDRYGIANVCNGLLCFVDGDCKAQAPAVVFNPATGETLALPEAPPLRNKDHSYFFALGFSPPTNEYKLFRLSFPSYSYTSDERVDVDVYTLGDTRGWRKDWFLSPSHPLTTRNNASAPVLIDGRLHVITGDWNPITFATTRPRELLVVDVPAETCRTYPLPVGLGTFPDNNPLAFELKGRLCFATHVRGGGGHPMVLRFWVMVMENKESDGKKEPHWELRYSLCVEAERRIPIRKPWSAWFQHEMIYYTRYDTLRMYATGSSVPDRGRLLQRYKQLQRISSSEWRWSIHRGYRPTLLSPRIFELPPPQDETMTDICS